MAGRVTREVERALARFRYMPPALLPGLLARAIRLHFGRPAFGRPGCRPERVVVTLTTIPGRARKLAPTLRSLLDQDEPASRIILALPHRSRRDGVAYPDPPQLGLPRGVDVLRCPDEGPATKLLPVLEAEPRATLVVVDDDVIYPRDFIATLLDAHRRRPDAAIGYRGVRLRGLGSMAELPHVFATGVAAPTTVDVLFGTWGYLLPPGALDNAVADFSGYPEAVRLVDDIWVSAHLARRGVPRIVAPARRIPLETAAAWTGALSAGLNRSGDNDRAALAALDSFWAGPHARNSKDLETLG
ncbi:hypothetical protein SLNSH_04295 [Alsobacter soli]|uniref:Glycosyltransferase n=1 Tax=Alsobacter soli TaxID=2109933 RepID=A0A2T1HY12_9HYPH|nr:glycosyltransferase family A protein [Alsobacter soli]PSC06504.1 hypothetical protein SLNSH_04295 [Alsobacter soli]